jgi:hypothetical protein
MIQDTIWLVTESAFKSRQFGGMYIYAFRRHMEKMLADGRLVE